jgi:hypothetical protein
MLSLVVTSKPEHRGLQSLRAGGGWNSEQEQERAADRAMADITLFENCPALVDILPNFMSIMNLTSNNNNNNNNNSPLSQQPTTGQGRLIVRFLVHAEGRLG